MPTALQSAMAASSQQQGGPMQSAVTEEGQFQSWARALPWFTEFKRQYGEEPNLDDPDYNYRAAWKAGILPQRYAPDGGRYHWPSALPSGDMLKSKSHPTAWMEEFMRATGEDPNVIGIKSEQEGRQVMSQRLRPRGGS